MALINCPDCGLQFTSEYFVVVACDGCHARRMAKIRAQQNEPIGGNPSFNATEPFGAHQSDVSQCHLGEPHHTPNFLPGTAGTWAEWLEIGIRNQEDSEG